MNIKILGIFVISLTPATFWAECGNAGPLADGYYEVRAMHSDKCLDVPRSSNRDEVEIIQYRCGNTKNQRWKLLEGPEDWYEIQAMNSGKCLDVSRSGVADGTSVIQYRCLDTTNQRWQLVEGPADYFEVRAMHSGKCLDVPRSRTADGVEIIQYQCGDTTNQRWEFIFTNRIPEPQRLDVVAISLGGASSEDIHAVVAQSADALGLTLVEEDNWGQDKGDAVAGNGDAERIRDKIDALVASNGGDKSTLSLLVVGKSAGGVLAWNAFRRHYDQIDDFQRVTVVTVDPHGSVWGDGRLGPYTDHQSLWWPSGWSIDTDFLRVYNIYQHRDWPYGASFPDRRAYRNIRISDSSVTHDNITGDARTRDLISQAIDFALDGRR